MLDLITSADERRQAAEKSRRITARANDISRYFRIMDGLFKPLFGGKLKPTPLPPTPPISQAYIEWSPPLQALNRVVRSYLDGEPLEGWALDLLAQQPQEEVDELAESVCRSLLAARDAAVLRTEQRLKRYVARSFFDRRLHDDTLFAVRVGMAERRGQATTPSAPGTIRAVVFGGLPLTVAGNAGEPDARPVLIADEHRVTTRRVADTSRYGGSTDLFQAEVPASDNEAPGLCTIVLAIAPTRANRPTRGRVGVLRHSVPISQGLLLLGREVFGGSFELRSDGAGADLPPGQSGTLQLPRIADGRHASYVDLCFSRFEAQTDRSSPRESPGLSGMLGKRPADIEVIGSGGLRVVRVFVTGDDDLEEFGMVPLTVVNQGTRATLRLVGVHSGLLLGPIAEAAGIATVLTLSGHRLDQSSYPRLAGLGRDAIAAIIAGEAPAAAALDALCTLAASTAGQDGLRSVASQELARAARQNGELPDAAGVVDRLIEDIQAIVGSSLGTVDPNTAVFSPALPFDIVDEAGELLPAQTEVARRRGVSWRVQMPHGDAIERIRIRLDAKLEMPDHPRAVTYDNFYPAEDPNALFRWTGPEPTSTVSLPLVLNKPTRLVIELGSVGRNSGRGDFTITCNGKQVAHNFETGGDDVARLVADLTPSRLAGPLTAITLTVKERFRPELPDRRTLGVVFRSLSLLIGGPDLRAWGGRRQADNDTELSAAPAAFGRVSAEPPVGLRTGNAADAAAAAVPSRARALVIDDSVPEPDKDAGANAILQHMLSLQRLGYAVGFAPADNMTRIDPYTAALEERGIECFHRPDHASLADLLAGQAPYELVYLHRHTNMVQHAAAVRAHSPQARMIYSVADLHFLRLQRQAELDGDKALRRQADAVRAAELAAMAAADCVIVHSAAEAELLRLVAPDTEVRVVPWTVEPRSPPGREARATTLAFIGGYRHPPNVDAAAWAVRELMPRLRHEMPGAELMLVGSHMPAEVASLAAPDVLAVGHVETLDEIYAQARLTIAPLRYGAGLKGKVLDSLAAGLPCVMSTIAAEGLELPEELQVLVADDPDILARRIAVLCRDDREYHRLAAAGQAYIAERYGAARIDALLREACGPNAAPPTPRRGSSTATGIRPAAEMAVGDGK